jgi:hypothetical protein
MTAFLTRALGAASVVALVGCSAPGPVPESTAAVPPGTPVVTTAPVVVAPPVAIATPPVAAVPVVPVAPGAGTSAVPLAAPGRITPSEVNSLLSGNTITGIDRATGQPYTMLLASNGQLRYRQGNLVDVGTWRSGPDGRFCTTRAQFPGREECYWLYRTATPSAVRFDNAASGISMGTFTVLPGNARGL